MWLINTATLRLEEFQTCPRNTYAILSHTWGSTSEELTFDEFKRGAGNHRKVGFHKIKQCCQYARDAHQLQYAWVDTCCINKNSSAELSEAINSMFEWYASAKICLVYLTDVSHHDPHTFALSRWFTRGWTLQELIAPQRVLFFDQDWVYMGSKSNLSQKVQAISGIPIDVLTSKVHFQRFSVAQRMSWASKRHTTRIEDSAYCLIGLFNINMPLLYGEGSKAFLRLQETIIQQTDDETIFAWTGVPSQGSGLLAPSAAAFVNSGGIKQGQLQHGHERPPYTKTNHGWSIECRMVPYSMNVYIVPLGCTYESARSDDERIAIFMCRTKRNRQYYRISSHDTCITTLTRSESAHARIVQIIVPFDIQVEDSMPHSSFPLLKVESDLSCWLIPGREEPHFMNEHPKERATAATDYDLPDSGILLKALTATSTQTFQNTTQTLFNSQDLRNGVVVAFEKPAVLGMRRYYYLQTGFDTDFSPVCVLRCGLLKWKSYLMSMWEPSTVIGIAFHKAIYLLHREVRLRPFSRFDSHEVKQPPLSFLSDEVVGAAHGDRIHGIEERAIRIPPLEYGCVEVLINLRLQHGNVWLLTFQERRPDPGHRCHKLFCERRFAQILDWLLDLALYMKRVVFPWWVAMSLARKFFRGVIIFSGLPPNDGLEQMMYFSIILLLSDQVVSPASSPTAFNDVSIILLSLIIQPLLLSQGWLKSQG